MKQGVEDKSKKEAAAGPSSSERPSKNIHMAIPENQTSRVEMIHVAKPENQTARVEMISPRPFLTDRTSSQLPRAQLSEKGKKPILSRFPSGSSKSNSKKPPYAEEPSDKPNRIRFERENVPSKVCRTAKPDVN